MTAATLKSAGATRKIDAPPVRLRTEVYDALAAAKGLDSVAAQARHHGINRSHWFRIRTGRQQPRIGLAVQIAEDMGTTVSAIWGRAA